MVQSLSAHVFLRCAWIAVLITALAIFSSCSQESEEQHISPPADADTLRWYQDQLVNADASGDTAFQVDLFVATGDYLYMHDRSPDSVLQNYERALNLAEERGLYSSVITIQEKIAQWNIRQGQFEDALQFLNSAAAKSQWLGDSSKIAWTLQELGIYYLDQRNYTEALDYFIQEMTYDSLMKNVPAMAACFGNMAITYSSMADYDNAVRCYREAMPLAEALDNDSIAAANNFNLGLCYKEQGLYDLAITHLLNAIRFYERKNSEEYLSTCCNTLGNVYLKLNDPDRAIGYYMRALDLRRKLAYEKGIASTLTNLSEAYLRRGNIDTAITLLEQSLTIKNKIGDPVAMSSSNDLMGEAYYLKKEFQRAEEYYLKSLELRASVNDPKGRAATLNKLGQLYLVWNEEVKAGNVLLEAELILEEIGAKNDLLRNYDFLMQLSRKNGDLTTSLKYYDKYSRLRDTILNELKNKALTEAQVKYDTEKKEQEILLLNAQGKNDAIELERQDRLIYSLIAGTSLLSAVMLLLILAARSRRIALRQSEIIIEQKQALIDQKQTMLRELHHRVKNNLQILSGILTLEERMGDTEHSVETMKAVNHRLNAMLYIHQDLYGDQGCPQIDMKEYIHTLVRNLSSSMGKPGDESRFTISVDQINEDADRALSIGFICNEAISNWFKYVAGTTNTPWMTIEFSGQILRFTDNGPGIDTSNSKQRSFGLRLMELFAADLGGEIHINSDANGTVITITISKQEAS